MRGRDEFALLGSAFNDMANQLQARLAELEAERGRLRDAITRFGEALAATHDVEQLLRVIVEAAVEATGATGARLVADDGRDRRDRRPGRRRRAARAAARPPGATTFGTLSARRRRFDEEQRMTAGSLASHAAIALENARLHRDRRAAGARRRPHRHRQPPPVRGRADRGDLAAPTGSARR